MTRQWLNMELDGRMEAEAMKGLLHENGIKFEASGILNAIHFEVYVDDEERRLVNQLVDVVVDLHNYFETSDGLSSYNRIERVTRLSSHKDDDYLYIVMAQRTDGAYAVWTSWNTSTKSLNHGHYGLTKEDAFKVIDEYKH